MNNSQPPTPPWQPQEKLELLTEIIRQSRIPPETVIQFITSHRISPDWGNMILPQRRSLNQCNTAYDDMVRSSASVTGGLMRSASVREFPGPVTAPPAAGLKRPFVPDIATYGGRMIQPRPEGAPLASPNEPSEPPKKKRGRPTKAEAEERRQAAMMRGDPYPAPRRGSTLGPIAPGSSSAIVARAPSAQPPPVRPPSVRPPSARPPSTRSPSVAPSIAAAQAALGMTSRAPTAGPRTPPPQQSQAAESETSSGKRRRGRSMAKLEEESRRPPASFAPARGPGPSRYPDILTRDEPPPPLGQAPRYKTTASQHSRTSEPPPR